MNFSTTGATVPFGNDSRFSNERVPIDGSVSNAKVGVGAAISADKLVDGSANKLMTSAERTKLAGIAAGATANDSDANLKARVNHTGEQAISTVTGLQTALDAMAADSAVVKLTGAQTVAGVKTFSSAPSVPDASFAIVKVNGLQAALDAKPPITPAANLGLDYSIGYAAAFALGSRPPVPAGAKIRIHGGSTSDPDPAWMVAGDYRQVTT